MTTAEIKAQEDWNARNVVVFTVNDINARYALIDATGFYIRCHNQPEFVKDYNKSIKDFVATHGIPDWAPIKRIPDLNLAKSLRSSAIPIDALRGKHQRYNRIVESIRKDFMSGNSGEPKFYSELPNRRITLVFGDQKYKRIDAIDDIEKIWVGTIPVQTHDYLEE